MYRRVYKSTAPVSEGSRRTQGALREELVGWDDEIGLETVNYHWDSTILAPNDEGYKPMKVGTFLDSGSGVTCILDSVATRLGAHVAGVQVTIPYEGDARVRVADGRELMLL